MVIEVKHYHDATPTWNGFTHQGKVAILVALDMFLEDSNCFLESECYELELEWLEDISIKKDGEYLSIHQVKAYQNGSISSYGNAIWMLLGKCHQKEIPNSYLHTVTSVELKKEIIKKVALKDSVEVYRSLINEENSFDDVFKKLNVYEYSANRRYCELEHIDELICIKIFEIINLNRDIPKTKDQVNITYLYLLDLIHQYITKRHIEIQKGEYKQNDQDRSNIFKISFKEIKDILLTDYEESSEEYYCLHLRKLFSEHIDEFVTHVIDKQKFDNEVIDSFKDVVSLLSVLKDEDFIKFCKRLSPHEVCKDLSITTYHSLLPKDGVLESFFETLIYLDTTFTGRKNGINYENNNKVYIPSAISSGIIHATRIARGILRNGDMLEELFLIDTIISKRMNIESIGEYGEKAHEVSAKTLGEETNQKEYEKITKIKKIRIIDIEKTKEELL